MDPTSNFPQDCETSKNASSRKRRSAVPDDIHSEEGNQEKGKKSRRYNSVVPAVWPQHFQHLFKIYKAISTVLAFVSTKKAIPTAYPTLKSSVENLLKHPLEMSSVAELKALLPDLIIFSYSQSDSIRIHEPRKTTATGRAPSPDFSFAQNRNAIEEEEFILILDFTDGPKGQKTRNSGFQYHSGPKSTNASLQKLLHKRNNMFQAAVNELLLKYESPEDAVEYLRCAAHQHVPTNPWKMGFSTVDTVLHIPDPENRISVDEAISQMMNEQFYRQQIVFRKTTEPKDAKIVTLDPPLSSMISQTLLSSRGISVFYSHQAAAISAISNGKNVIVSTSTASGKSLIYQVPILRYLEENIDATAILVYPTKALAQDQLSSFEQLLTSHPLLAHLKAYTYDGDTSQGSRTIIRQSANLIFTNFDMLHMSILPCEELWRRFIQNLKLVVIDELHYYSGLFGSHVAQIVRRLRRLCAAVGNRHVKFVSCTATILNPLLHMHALTGLPISDIEVVSDDGAPSGQKEFIIWDPRPTSAISDATTLMMYLMTRGIRVILFCKLRKVCELVMKNLITALGNNGRHDILERVKPYRGGYSPAERREIERDAFSGHLLGIVSTNALELGVDIGVLDAVMMLGFPGTISSFRQQVGRAGRRTRDSLAILVAEPFPIDQHYLEHSSELFEQISDDIAVDINSPEVLEAHLQCAAYEMPLCTADEAYFGPAMLQICKEKLSEDKDGWYHTHQQSLPFPAKDISIRGVIEDKYSVIRLRSTGKADCILEELEVSRAMFEIYEGGVFMHQGMTYVVKEINHDLQLAMVIRANVNYITSPRDYTNIDAIETHRIKEFQATRAFYGRVNIYVKVFGFFKVKDHLILDAVELDTPPWDRETTGFWIDIPTATLHLLRDRGIPPAAAIHSAQHAFLNQFYLSRDIGTECKAPEKEFKVTESSRKRPARLIFYDVLGRGGGVASKAFDKFHIIMQKACDAVERCACTTGCLSCVCCGTCREANEVCSKSGALAIIKSILGSKIDPSLLVAEDINKGAADTIVEAGFVRSAPDIRIEIIAASSPGV